MAILGLLLIALGFALYKGGRLGTSVGSHPFCTNCGFDLFALPLETRRCPECGADILADNAIRIGQRRPIAALMAVGAIIAAGGILFVGLGVAAWWPHFDGSSYKPLVWLESDIRSPDSALRRRTCEELSRRIAAGAVSHAQVDALADEILSLQADPAVPWYSRWGDLIQQARAADPACRISPALWQRYILQASTLSALVRPRITIGDPVPITITCEFRAGSDFTALQNLKFTPAATVGIGSTRGLVAAAGQSPDSHGLPFSWNLLWLPSQLALPSSDPRAWPANISTGPQTLSLAVTLSATDAGQSLATLKKNFSLSTDILPAAQPSVTLRHGGSAAAGSLSPQTQMARSIRLNGVPSGFRPLPPGTTSATPAPLLFVNGGVVGSLWISSPPVCASFRVVLRQNGPGKSPREWGLARLMVRPDDAATIPLSLEAFSSVDGPANGPAQIVCIPDPAMAAGTVDILEVWGDPLVFPVTIDSGSR